MIRLPVHIAHRALHDRRDGRPENSRAAIRAALDRGYAIEIDIQPASDGVAMVFHDAVLDRLTDATGPVAGHTADDLGRTRLRGGADGIPTLAEVLAMVDGAVPLLIEVKDQDGEMGPNVGPLEDAVIDALHGYGGEVAVMSFNPHAVAHLAERAPDLPRGLTTSAFDPAHWPELGAATRDRLRAMPDLDRVGAQFISHEAAALDMPEVARVRATGRSILCWTVRSATAEATALRIADGVTFEGYLP
ncbi:glycerophosphodiester phosphodiesterase family protein [uncultured Jannaschia sp.]|uniref:glycerophosphodiester phosphodiesterase family protein n=1 Tax=uncultured Jannaschia sp. TaxID=293347 RepID=UPI002622DCA1|nr:glycerophosphodiester phosphodiesterase family protein [uncultured Jannaschia sp.]